MNDSPLQISVVVLEADPDNRNMYATFLESQGASVYPVTTSADVVACLHSSPPPDALIFDLVHSDMPVAAFCDAVKEAACLPSPRLIMVTGWLLSAHERAALARQGVTIHQKPCSLDTLWATLRG